MDFIEVSIETTTEGIDMLVSILEDLGVNGFTIEDSQDFNEFLETVTPHWDYVDENLMKLREAPTTVKIYPADNAQGRILIRDVLKKLDELRALDVSKKFGELAVTFKGLHDEDWANAYKKYFKPFPVGERLVVKPSWEAYEAGDNRIVLEIDPSSSFGTGSHETTRLCLESLENLVRPGDRVLDMGCGSGILSVAALLLGAGHVTCVDIDENCIATTRENLLRNGFLENAYRTFCGNAIADTVLADTIAAEPYDLISANIVADVIIAMRPLFHRCLKPGGMLLTSGIIGQRAAEVADQLESAGFSICERLEKNDWVLYRVTI